MSNSFAHGADVPPPAIPPAVEKLKEQLTGKFRIASDASKRFMDAMSEDQLREASLHYMLDQIGRIRAKIDEMSKLIIEFIRDDDEIILPAAPTQEEIEGALEFGRTADQHLKGGA